MARLTSRQLVKADIFQAAELLATRHRRDSQHLPAPSSTMMTAEGCASSLEAHLEAADGAVAIRDGRIVGFLFGTRTLPPPDNFAAQFIPPHSISLAVEGHACAEGEDTSEVYRDMYRLLAEGWVSDGFFVHRWNIPAGNAEVQEAVVALGFGRHMTAAVRAVDAPVVGHVSDAVDVRVASEEDIGVVTELALELLDHHNQSPMFWPLVQTAHAAQKDFNLAMLRAGDPPYFIGYLDGKPQALQTFLKPGFTPPIVEQEPNVYLFEGMVSSDVQAGGVGTAMLARGMEWASEAGHKTCTLHFASQNFSGGPFWLKQGFVPVEYTMDRTVDERVLWGRR